MARHEIDLTDEEFTPEVALDEVAAAREWAIDLGSVRLVLTNEQFDDLANLLAGYVPHG